MVRRRGPRLTAAQKAELWRRWRQGESLNALGRALGRISKCVQYIVVGAGGVPPVPRHRARQALTLAEREAISRGVARGTSLRQISRDMGRAPSTVSREVRRHGGRCRYRAADADRTAWARGRRPKRCRLATHPALRDTVATQLAQAWSPQQIAGWLRQAYPDDPTMHVSHETIYLSLFVQSRGGLKKALQAQLRRRRTYRRPRSRPRRAGTSSAPSRFGSGRPPSRTAPSPATGKATCSWAPANPTWPGSSSGAHAMCASCASPGKKLQTVVYALAQHVQRLPAGLMTTLTWDRGLELAAHRTFSNATGVQVYFCDPQSPWQRGTNENTNGLLRQYLPKGTDLAAYTQTQLDAIALQLNTRPRKTLGYRTPAATLAETVASTG